MRSIYIKRNMLHRNKFGQEVELQKTHINFFKTPLDVMQVNMFSAQLGLGSEIVQLSKHEKSLPYSHLLIDLSPQTEHRLRYCTKTGSIPSKKSSRTGWNNQRFWTMIKRIFSTLQVFQSFSHKFQVFSHSVSPKRFYQVSLRMHSNSV